HFNWPSSNPPHLMGLWSPLPLTPLPLRCVGMCLTPLWSHSDVVSLHCGLTPLCGNASHSAVVSLHCGLTPLWSHSTVVSLRCVGVCLTPLWSHSAVSHSAVWGCVWFM